MFPMANKLVRLAEITIPDNPDKDNVVNTAETAVAIDERFIDRPAFAMELCRQKVYEMAHITSDALITSLNVLISYDESDAKKVIDTEELVDKYEDALGSYLVRLSSKNISTKDSQSLSIILHSISDFERISDHALSIVNSSKEIHDKHLSFSEDAGNEIKVLCKAVGDIVRQTTESFCNEDTKGAKHVEPLEEVIDVLSKVIKEHHMI